jgi:hypothetical protein
MCVFIFSTNLSITFLIIRTTHRNIVINVNTLKKIRPVGAELFHADRQTDMKKPIVAFRNFANAPKFSDKVVEKIKAYIYVK